MTLSQFEAMIRTYGPSVDEWPVGLAESALDLLQGSLAAQDVFARASLNDAPKKVVRDVLYNSLRADAYSFH